MSSWRRSVLAALAAVIVVGPVLAQAAPATADPVADVRINEVESSGGTPGDWVELVNNGAADANIGGWVVKDNDDTHSYTIPAGSIIAAGGYYVVDTDLSSQPGNFGLGSADSARLYTPNTAALVDAYSWTAHATVTYGRCPNGTGAFVDTVASTKGAPNSCPAAAGTYWWTATYSGDGNNNSVTSACLAANELVVIAPFQAPPFTSIVTGDLLGPVNVNAGQSVLINAARVVGPVTVNPGGALTITNSQVSQGITADAPKFLSICGSQVSGPSPAQALGCRTQRCSSASATRRPAAPATASQAS